MDDRTKLVLVLRNDLPLNQAVNAAVVLGTSAAHLVSAALGSAGTDASGHLFAGITTIPVPVLVAGPPELTSLHRRSAAGELPVTAIAFTEVARRARTYAEYLAALATTRDADEDLVGVLVHGAATAVNRATRKLSLLPSNPTPAPAAAR